MDIRGRLLVWRAARHVRLQAGETILAAEVGSWEAGRRVDLIATDRAVHLWMQGRAQAMAARMPWDEFAELAVVGDGRRLRGRLHNGTILDVTFAHPPRTPFAAVIAAHLIG